MQTADVENLGSTLGIIRVNRYPADRWRSRVPISRKNDWKTIYSDGVTKKTR